MTVVAATGAKLFIGPVRPSTDYSSVVTMTIAVPGVITWTGHGLAVNTPITFTTTGALPTGLTPGTTYYVRNPLANTFEVSLTSGGASITTSGTQSGVHTATRGPVDTAAEYATLTYVEIGEIENLGEFGDEAAIINFTSLADSRVRKIMGPNDAGTLALVVGRDPFNAGQIAAKAASKTKFEYAFKIEAADKLDTNDTNSIYYFGALVLSARENYGEATNVVKTTFNLGINTAIVEVLATIVP